MSKFTKKGLRRQRSQEPSSFKLYAGTRVLYSRRSTFDVRACCHGSTHQLGRSRIPQIDVFEMDVLTRRYAAAVEDHSQWRTRCSSYVLKPDILDLHLRGLPSIALVVGAVVLVNNDGLVHVNHLNVVKGYIVDRQLRRWGPGLDPDPILCTFKDTFSNGNTFHVSLVTSLAQTSNADAVTGTTINLENINVP